jgi:Outer membrane protein beta-barrel domain
MKKLALFVTVLCVAALATASAFAAGPLRAVGIEAGYVSPDLGDVQNPGGTWVAGAFLDFGMPMTNLAINPFVNYWNWSDGTGSSETSLRDWTVGANLKLTIPTAAVHVQPFVAAGASVHMLNASVGSIGASDTKFGFQAGGGLKIGVSQSANIIGSGWYHSVDSSNYWSVRGGLAWSI